ncbi:MAG: winged helix-turn-helix domain-containing protein [Planctomycetes bacterium]|nr:winged helix-turn-helix domain-containing protein [Planctomycetota bacterium]
MKKHKVKVGGTYLAKVSEKVVQVRIDGESRFGGWDATNLATKKKVRIKSAQRLRGPAVTSKAALESAAKDISKVLGIPVVVAPEAKATKQAKVETWRKEAAEKAGQPDPELDAAVKAAEEGRTAKKAKAARPKGERKGGCLDAAAKVLAEAGHPMQCKAIVEAALKKGLWHTKGQTPEATLYSALLRHIEKQGKASRFRRAKMNETRDGKVQALRGYFDLADAARKEA